jgi:site-specific DNA-methyltransferase (adenine-specific)
MKAKISDIEVTNRDRVNFKNLEKLEKSLRTYGQIQPIVVTTNPPDSKYKYRLVVGERRIRAAMMVGITALEAVMRKDLDEISLKELELEENVQREDLTWQEQCEAKLKLDELKRQRDKDWTIEDTAKLVNSSVGGAFMDIELARAMRKDKNVKRYLSRFPKTTAHRKLKEIERHRKMDRLVKSDKFKLTCDFRMGDCIDLIDTIPDASVHMILTDPPFGVVGIESHMDSKHKTDDAFGKYDNATPEFVRDLMNNLIPKLSRVMIPGGFFFMFFGIEYYTFLVEKFQANDFHVVPVPIIWLKNRTTSPFFGYSFQDCYESILYGYRNPKNRMLKKGMKNVIECNILTTREKTHPFEKPHFLLRTLIDQATAVGETVLDPCAGTGSTLLAAVDAKRKPIGFELSKKHYLTGVKRLSLGD